MPPTRHLIPTLLCLACGASPMRGELPTLGQACPSGACEEGRCVTRSEPGPFGPTGTATICAEVCSSSDPCGDGECRDDGHCALPCEVDEDCAEGTVCWPGGECLWGS